ncbi:MAG: hypothetical protein OHK0053_32010 [Microscillaceae bacterium]
MRYLLPLMHCAFLLCGWCHPAGAQEIVSYDYAKNIFNNQQPLPAEKQFALTGEAPPEVALVEVRIYDKNSLNKKNARPLYEANWQRGLAYNQTVFYVPIGYKLKGSTEYDIVLDYFRPTAPEEVQNAKDDLMGAITAYLSQNLVPEKKKLSLAGQSGEILANLNAIVRQALRYYRSLAATPFVGFSDLVQDKLRRIEKDQIGKAKRLFVKKSKREAMNLNRQKNLDELTAMIRQEINFLFNAGLVVRAESRTIDNVETEKTRNVLTLHGGYSGLFLNEGNSEYESGFTVGLTIPFGKRDVAKPFWSRSGLVAGIFLQDFTLDNDLKVTGVFINLPSYLGVGYKIFPYVRLMAGGTFLKYDDDSSGLGEDIFVRPFVGLVLDIDLWFNLRK